jgi:hypothetical protein
MPSHERVSPNIQPQHRLMSSVGSLLLECHLPSLVCSSASSDRRSVLEPCVIKRPPLYLILCILIVAAAGRASDIPRFAVIAAAAAAAAAAAGDRTDRRSANAKIESNLLSS